MDQHERNNVFNKFQECKNGLLLCTDVGSRGLDFKKTDLIIIFDIANSEKDYVNRVGRTARLNNKGTVINLLYQEEQEYSEML